jgi:aminopeptidase YwaD
VTADLVDVAEGMRDSDYAGKDVKGKIVLAAAAADDVQDIAVGKFNAAGIISYAQNQKTAWSGDDDNLIRWGHLATYSANKTFAFMVSLKTARRLSERLSGGEKIQLHARVAAGQHPSAYEVVTGTLPGSDPQLKDSEIAFSCHLDHQRPGANDNASGCVTILEVARTLQKLIAAGQLPQPARTLRFIWPPEVEGTVTLLNARPEFARNIKAAIHMDMVGGNTNTHAVFHVTRGPLSLPSFVHDVAWSFASWLNTETARFAAGESATYPMIAPEGSKDGLRAEYAAFTMGSDHDVLQDSSFGIPTIYLNDWPDRYIHTNFDSAANIDPTKLKRAAFIGAASGYFLANFSAPRDTAAVRTAVQRGRLLRTAEYMDRQAAPTAVFDEYERKVLDSVGGFATTAHGSGAPTSAAHPGAPVFRRQPAPRGPLMVFGYDYFADYAKAANIATPRLLSYDGEWGGGMEYAYEAVNLANGTRTTQQITAVLSAEYGTIPEDVVVEYLQALQKIGIVTRN